MRQEPPITYATSHWDPGRRVLEYGHNGRALVSMTIPGEGEVRYRMASDGQVQSWPLHDQIYIVVSEPARTRVTFTMTSDALVMRPRRAGPEQAVLGQIGRPTMDGVNGIYDINEDLLVWWNCRPWRWVDDRLRANDDGALSGTIEVDLSREPWIINILPQYYRTHLGYRYHRPWERRPNTKAVAGWCSWEAYRREVTEENIADAARFVAEHFRDWGMEYIQVDDGYQRIPVAVKPGETMSDAWLNPNERFPSGLDDLCNKVKDVGLKPGIWLSTDIWDPEADTPAPDCLLKGADGKPLKPPWMHAAADCSPAMLEEHVRPTYEGLRRMGFEYVKTDQIRHLLYDALQEMLRMGLMGNDEVEQRFRAYMETARQGLGPDVYYLSSWGVLSQVVGIADACRIATDANPQWQKVRMQIIESARWMHTQRILFTNDPDHICARTNPDWARTLLSLVSLSGGLFMLSDAIETYDEERIRMIRRCLPPLATYTGETGPLDMHYPAYAWTKPHGKDFKGVIETAWDEVSYDDAFTLAGYHDTMHDDHPLSSLWAFHMDTDVGRWCVALRAGEVPLRPSILRLERLGLDPGRGHAAFDFWAERYLGIVRREMEVPGLDVGCCQVIALREALDRPQFLASTRHVSMDAVSVKKQTWEDGALTLSLTGVPNTTETYWFHRPGGWRLASVKGNGADASHARSGPETDAVSVAFASLDASVRILWERA